VRFDYLLDQKSNKVYLNEVNAIPGSLAYYLFEKMDIKMIDLIDLLIEQYYIDLNNERKKISSYREDFLTSLKEK
jgi:D-alanine-D-alanine ligase